MRVSKTSEAQCICFQDNMIKLGIEVQCDQLLEENSMTMCLFISPNNGETTYTRTQLPMKLFMIG